MIVRNRPMYVAVPFWAMTGAFLAPCVWPRRRGRLARERAARGLCPQCAYDVRATPARCPECGCVSSNTGAV